VGIAADLGIMGGTLSAWLKAAGVQVHRVLVDGLEHQRRAVGQPSRSLRGCGRGSRNWRLTRKLNSERDILRAAARYFAGETRW
jgi:transposase